MSAKLIKHTRKPLILTKDVKNPKPDRRYGPAKWEFHSDWLEGTTFFINTETYEKEDGTTFEIITLEYCYHRVDPCRVPDLVAALKAPDELSE